MSPRRTDTGGAHRPSSRTIRFTFDGKAFTGHPGDTLASALLANGVYAVRPLVQISSAARRADRRHRRAECAGDGAEGRGARAQHSRHHAGNL